MSIDSLGDFLTIIRNGCMAAKPFVVAPFSKMRESVVSLLKEEGFVKDFHVLQEDHKKFIKIYLRYVEGESSIHEITRVSTPGRRVYAGVKRIKPVIGGLGVSIITSPKGVITHKQAKELGVGGEVLLTVW